MSEEISLKCKISEMKHYSLCYFSEKSVMQEKKYGKEIENGTKSKKQREYK